MENVERIEDLLMYNPYIGKRTTKDENIFRIIVLRHFYIYYMIKDDVVNVIAFKGASQGDTNIFGL